MSLYFNQTSSKARHSMTVNEQI